MQDLDKLFDRINSIDRTLAAQHVSLVEHIRRTEVLEKALEPVKRDMNKLKGAFALLGLLAAVLEIVMRLK